MRRRTLLTAAAGGLVAIVGAGAFAWTRVPVIPKRPEPDAAAALGWIAHKNGRFTLAIPRAEIGQNIATALKQIACTELGVAWDAVDVVLHRTNRIGLVKATVGSESVMRFAEPLAQACAALRDALAVGRASGTVAVVPRPVAQLRALRTGGLIGASPELSQGREIVTGVPLFASDVRRPKMLFGQVLRAPASVEVGSRPRLWNLSAAQAVPGFVAVVEDCGAPIGQATGLGIVAARPGALNAIAEALSVEWEIDGVPTRSDVAAAIDVDTRLSRGALPNRVLSGEPLPGAWNVDLRIDVPLAAHGPIEPRAAVAEWSDGRLDVWTGTQDAFYVRDVLSRAFDIEADAVVVNSCRVGGAFGGKTICTVEAEAAALARAVRAPVKVQWTRAQEFALGFHRPPSSHRIRARVKAGRITDWDHAQSSSHILFTSAALPAWLQVGTDVFAGDGGVARGMAHPYSIARARAAYDLVRLPVHTGPWRGLGAGPNGLAIESAMDEAAIVASMDSLSFRLNHIRDERLATVLRRVAALAKWGGAATPGRDGERLGRGIACGIYKDTSYAAAIADVAVDVEGKVRVTRMWCVHDCGLVINPDQVRAQCEGNLVWSIGMVLSDMLPVEAGRVTAQTFGDAPIPRLTDVPPITVELVSSDLPPTGSGETMIVAGPGAIANGVRAATGVRPARFPLTATAFVP
jgi:isoquinoline 1-oxidoreductase subunit beta